MDTQIRIADESDSEAIREIYNHYVRTSTCTFHLEPESSEDRLLWMRAHDDRHPVTVCCADEVIVGWASLTRFHPRPAYARTAEISVYLHPSWHRRGIGRRLLTDLIARARMLGFHVLIGGVCTEQVASIELQKSLGFVEVGRFTEVGHKFGRWLDVAYYQLTLVDQANHMASESMETATEPGE